jgi:stage III sporulation protein AE
MKKFLTVLIIFEMIIILFSKSTIANNTTEIIDNQKQNLKISDFINEAQEYTKEAMPDFNLNDLLSTAISGNIDNVKLMKLFWSLLGKEVLSSAAILGSIIVIVVIHSILKSISDGLGNQGASQVAYYVQYIMIVALIMTSFAEIITTVKQSIQNLVSFINLLIPILITLMITTGSITSAGILEPLILFMVTIIGNFIVNVVIPITLVSTALGIISQISDKVQIDKLAKFMKSSTIWVLGVILTLFVGITSLEGNLSSSVDGVTAKTTKAAVSNFIPVVGKILGDAVDTVMGCSIILKNALGVVGVIVIIGICIVPILKLATLMIMYYLGSALCQPIADGKIIKLLSHMGDTFKLLLAVLCSVSVMLIIGVTLIVRISNSSAMYG